MNYLQHILNHATSVLCQTASGELEQSQVALKESIASLCRKINSTSLEYTNDEPDWDGYFMKINNLLDREREKNSMPAFHAVCLNIYKIHSLLNTELDGEILSNFKNESAEKMTGKGNYGSPTFCEFLDLILKYRIPKLVNNLVKGERLTDKHGKKWSLLKGAAKQWLTEETLHKDRSPEDVHRAIIPILKVLLENEQKIQNDSEKGARGLVTGFFNKARTAASDLSGGKIKSGKGELGDLLEPFVERFTSATSHTLITPSSVNAHTANLTY